MSERLCLFLCLLLATPWSLAQDENGLAYGQDDTEQENKNNLAQYAIECADESRIPEHVINCELLIAGLKADSGVNRNELCCTLLSSRATKSMCCHEIRDLCDTYNVSQCPKNRRRIKPPRLTPVKNRKSIDQKFSTEPPAPIFLQKLKKTMSPRL